MRDGFPRLVVLLLVGLFLASLVALLSWFAYFVSGAVFLGRPGALGGLRLTAALSGGGALSSWLLAIHYDRDAYTSGEATLYRACMMVFTGILLCSGIWAALVSVFD